MVIVVFIRFDSVVVVSVCKLRCVMFEWCLGVIVLKLLVRIVIDEKFVKLYSVNDMIVSVFGLSICRLVVVVCVLFFRYGDRLLYVMNLLKISFLLMKLLVSVVLCYGMLMIYVSGVNRWLMMLISVICGKFMNVVVLLMIRFISVMSLMNVISIVLMLIVMCSLIDVLEVVVLIMLVVCLLLKLRLLIIMWFGLMVGNSSLLNSSLFGIVMNDVVSRYFIFMLRLVYLISIEFVIDVILFVIIVKILVFVMLCMNGFMSVGILFCLRKIVVMVEYVLMWFMFSILVSFVLRIVMIYFIMLM